MAEKKGGMSADLKPGVQPPTEPPPKPADMGRDGNPLDIALLDAATNCARDGAEAILTLHSGVQYQGELERKEVVIGTVQMHLGGGGWVTIDRSQIAAVEARPKELF